MLNSIIPAASLVSSTAIQDNNKECFYEHDVYEW